MFVKNLLEKTNKVSMLGNNYNSSFRKTILLFILFSVVIVPSSYPQRQVLSSIVQVSSTSSIAVSSTAWTLVGYPSYSNRDGMYVTNISTNLTNFRGLISTSSVLPVEGLNVFSYEVPPALVSNGMPPVFIPISDGLYLWFTSTGTSVTQNINVQQVRFKFVR